MASLWCVCLTLINLLATLQSDHLSRCLLLFHSSPTTIHCLPDGDEAHRSLSAVLNICHASHRHLTSTSEESCVKPYRRCLSSQQYLRQVCTVLSWVLETYINLLLSPHRMLLVRGPMGNGSVSCNVSFVALLRGAIALLPLHHELGVIQLKMMWLHTSVHRE